ncbi:MlaD family protein [Candidatus Protofrankia californiensis]|uniref:MlaD family protein n=1 Tax=Candidatus Protofrankia californiensis TaxID=1839754 RepID=UPI001F49965D|nr:MlaD family protein [Candidatus Protofrankia californiensis]
MMATPEARKNSRSVGAGLIVLVLVGVGLYIASTAQTGLPLARTTTVKASIDDINTLSVNDDVRQRSKRIGRVSAIDFVDGKALVTMKLDGDRQIYKDARAAVWDTSALAQKFVELDPGTSDTGKLEDKVIPATQTTGSSDLQQLLSVLDPETRAQASSTIREIAGGVAGHSQDIHDFLGVSPDLLNDLGTTAEVLASDQLDLPALLRSADQLVSRFNGREEQISALVKQTDSTLRGITVDQGKPLEATLSKAPATLQEVRSALHSLDTPLADLQVAMTNLEPGAASLGQSTPDLRGVLREAVPVLGKVPGVAEHAEPAVEDLRQTFADARPLAPKVTDALGYLATPLGVLAPYGPEIGQFFVRGHSFVSEGPAPGIRFARLSANVGVGSVTGGLYGSDNFPRNDYPEPGEATRDRATTGLPPGLLPSGGRR